MSDTQNKRYFMKTNSYNNETKLESITSNNGEIGDDLNALFSIYRRYKQNEDVITLLLQYSAP